MFRLFAIAINTYSPILLHRKSLRKQENENRPHKDKTKQKSAIFTGKRTEKLDISAVDAVFLCKKGEEAQ